MKENIIKEKSFEFAIRMVKLHGYLSSEKKEYILSKQMMRSGTAVGAMIRESEHSESKADFIHKMAVAQKEINECIYWLELLKATEYLSETQFNSVNDDAVELIKIITAIIKKAKSNH